MIKFRISSIVSLLFSALYVFGSYSALDDAQGVGPYEWALIVAIIMFLLSLGLFIFPDTPKPVSKQEFIAILPAVFAIIVYGIVLEYLGFIVSTIVLVAIMSIMFGANYKIAIINAVLITLVLFASFEYLLDISLAESSLLRGDDG